MIYNPRSCIMVDCSHWGLEVIMSLVSLIGGPFLILWYIILIGGKESFMYLELAATFLLFSVVIEGGSW